MAIPIRSFAKINIGLCIGGRRSDGFHQLRTVYQTISLHDTIRVDVGRGSGIEIRAKDTRVPLDESNTCWRMAERVMRALKQRGKVVIAIDKVLPVQGGLGAASSNAVATMLAIERALKQELAPEERLRLTAEVGSDVPLFLAGGTVLGTGRGEEVWPLQDLPPIDMVVVAPDEGVSTPEAFQDWDQQFGEDAAATGAGRETISLTEEERSGRIHKFSQAAFVWLAGSLLRSIGRGFPGHSAAGVPVSLDAGSSTDNNGGRAETLLLDLVRAGMENDFERVVFPKHPKLREVKRALEREGARYASLSGSGSTLYGLFENSGQAEQAARRLSESGLNAVAAQTITRNQYWREMVDA